VPAGSFCLVLHGHLPWVLHHGYWPHGEVWLYEAAAETWLPLLTELERCAAEGVRTPITLGLVPVLLEQLGSPAFVSGFRTWLHERRARAGADAVEFTRHQERHLAWLAQRWERHFEGLIAQFDALGGDIAGAFARLAREGRIELLTSNATHAYMPLVEHDRCARAQVRAGVATSLRRLGFAPRGAWLPECAYRGAGPWTPPVVHGDTRDRAGVEEILGDEGVGFFFVDAHLFAGARSEGMIVDGAFVKVGWDQASWDGGRRWRSVLEPHLVSTRGGPGRVVALARHPEVSEQVWSGQVGYPGDGRYLEFHKRHQQDGHRYWKVTGTGVGLGDKQAWIPDDTVSAARDHARHFVATVRSILARNHAASGRSGVVVAPFDAELFGHWWHEGVRWIGEVFRLLQVDPEVRASTVSDFLDAHPPDKVVSLPEGSWGEGGDHRVWLNPELTWVWEASYRAEDRFLATLDAADWRGDAGVHEALIAAARELLLLQASDWAFVIHTRGAVDYGYRRFCEHLARFDRACTIAATRARGDADAPLARLELDDMVAHDDCFRDLRLEWWDG
jgi:1,4-alpha-glucan branching enzyme